MTHRTFYYNAASKPEVKWHLRALCGAFDVDPFAVNDAESDAARSLVLRAQEQAACQSCREAHRILEVAMARREVTGVEPSEQALEKLRVNMSYYLGTEDRAARAFCVRYADGYVAAMLPWR